MSLRQRLQRLEAVLGPAAAFIRAPGESEDAALVRAAVERYGLERVVRASLRPEERP